MNEILQKRIKEAACEESSTYDLTEIKESNAAYNAAIKVATFILQNQWISVEEALPEENELVFGCVNDESTPKAIGMAYYDEYGGWHYSDEEEISLITHWMPIPSLEGGEE